MKLTIAFFVTMALATVANADSLYVTEVCFGGCSRSGTFSTDYGRYSVNANDGCRGTSVPGMTQFCMDWKKNRGHFKFSHQSNKRCLTLSKSQYYSCGGGFGTNICYEYWFKESRCTWREIPDDEEELESVSATVVPTTLQTATIQASAETEAEDVEEAHE